MYKLLIVEDEVWEREGLASFLDWSALGIEFVGSAANGIEGLKMTREYIPDIIMTDIRMPVMDGLEFSREVKSFLPKCKIIIITGHDDFQYAKEALHIGVSDFLLKPVQREELLNAINRIKERLQKEKNQENYISELRTKLTERIYKERERILLNILAGKDKHCESLINDEKLMYPFCSQKTIAVVIRFEDSCDKVGTRFIESNDFFSMFYKNIRELVGNKGLTAANYMGKKEIVVCLAVERDSRREVNELVYKIRQENPGEINSDYIIGVGTVSDGFSEFAKSFRHAEIALDKLFYLKDTDILFYDDYSNEDSDASVCTFLNAMPDYSKRVLNAVISSDADNVIALTDELFEFIYNHPVDKNLVCNFLAGMINEISVLLFSNGATTVCEYYAVDDIIEKFKNCIKLEQLKEFVCKALFHASEFFSGKRKNKEEKIIDEVICIISNDYDKNIGLEVIAHRLGISPNYLGNLFKKYVGKRFTEFLTSFRMEKAEELLLSGQKSIMEIAREVGYDNVSYFCTVFKKIHGISPIEYREKNAYDNRKKE